MEKSFFIIILTILIVFSLSVEMEATEFIDFEPLFSWSILVDFQHGSKVFQEIIVIDPKDNLFSSRYFGEGEGNISFKALYLSEKKSRLADSLAEKRELPRSEEEIIEIKQEIEREEGWIILTVTKEEACS